MSDPTLLPVDLQDKLAESFVECVLEVVKAWQIPYDAVHVSSRELALALRECQKDLDILLYRRAGTLGPTHEGFDGVSIGKLAGTLIFRLSRYRIVHVDEKAIESLPLEIHKRVSKLQEVAAFRFICEDILKIKPPRTHPELLYLLSRRHMNQEMLGLTLDVFSEHCSRLKTQTSVDKPPFSTFYKRA
ncbi:hypothetical protein J2847_000629 [Azospirillum agricola]|uniref:hypothetical protein n=1 Tax=Azospirillum agricola TaxID=1720247 RepID=UPI001AE5193A|nr:hypothetical protein [Azospirillum agricola]MBP2227349.1 hypothetical protein [Azospirillum agricola]